MCKQVELLKHHAQFGAHAGKVLAFLRQGFALDEDLARVDGFQTVDGAAHGRLARARGADHNDDLAAVDREIDVVEDVQIAIVLIDVSELDQRLIAGGRGALCHGARLLMTRNGKALADDGRAGLVRNIDSGLVDRDVDEDVDDRDYQVDRYECIIVGNEHAGILHEVGVAHHIGDGGVLDHDYKL